MGIKRKIGIWMLLCFFFAGMAGNGTAYAASGSTSSQEQASQDQGQDSTEQGQQETEEKTASKNTATKKKKGNCDQIIGLSDNNWVLATAKSKVRVYKKQSTSSTVLGSFTKNNCIVVNTKGMKKGKNYKWLRVYLKNNTTGYLPLYKVSLGKLNVKNFGLSTDSKKNRQRIKICRYGLPYLGTKFVLGGSSLKYGIDCSTFARKALRNAGIMVSNSALAVTLSNSGKKIKRSQLKPGDMVFYYTSYKNMHIGHCAIYIGNGYIINASGHQGKTYPSGGIRISRIDYRKPTAVKFRNLVGN